MIGRAYRVKRAALSRAGHCVCAVALVACTSSGGGSAGDTHKPAAIEPVAETPEVKTPAINAAAHHAEIRTPVDATPSPDGQRLYYIAFKRNADGEDEPGVFSAAASGDDEPTALTTGAPLAAPVGVTISLDGTKLFVADTATGPASRGGVLTLASAGGTPSVLSGTDDYAPQAVTIARVDKQEYLFFTGRDPASGAAGLFRVAAEGGQPQALTSGSPFDDPSGVTVSAKGDAYVVDLAPGGRTARIYSVHAGAVRPLVDGVGVGFPAGITLTKDDSTLLVSGLDPDTKRDLVYFVSVATATISRLTKVVGAFSESAGLHRAHDVDVFAWADSEADGSGTVYVVKP